MATGSGRGAVGGEAGASKQRIVVLVACQFHNGDAVRDHRGAAFARTEVHLSASTVETREAQTKTEEPP